MKTFDYPKTFRMMMPILPTQELEEKSNTKIFNVIKLIWMTIPLMCSLTPRNKTKCNIPSFTFFTPMIEELLMDF